MAELLIELFSEEIPARMQARAALDLKRLVTEGLDKAGLTHTRAECFATPRRLTLVIDGLPETRPDVTEARRGPRTDAPEAAVNGFLKGAGVTLDQCEKRATPKGEFWFAVIKTKGGPAADVLPGLLVEALSALPWPKSMRWGSHDLRWVRPLHSIVALFAGTVVPFAFGPVASGATTRGHRFMAPDEITVTGFDDYRQKLRDAFVILDGDERRRIIAQGATDLAKAQGLVVKDDPALLDEVAGLVEWPVPLMGRIDAVFMDVPAEVLITSMRAHQKYFSCLDGGGDLAPRFVVIANREAEGGDNRAIVSGNERVLRARLSDAKFFWDQDRGQRLENRVGKLAERVFYRGLGTTLDKVGRMEKLARALAPSIPGCDPERAARAARLAKADLSTGMVGEFPELQGIMGRYYALNDGEGADVADAVARHYAPQGPDDQCPTDPLSIAVALADKLDTLAGFWSIDEKPTGSKDPFALRRAALGVIRLVVENGLRLGLLDVIRDAHGLVREYIMISESAQRRDGVRAAAPGATDYGDTSVVMGTIDETIAPDLLAFFAERLKVALREKGVRHDLIDAVFALGGEDDLVRLLARVGALSDFLGTDDGANLLVAFRRAVNILTIEEKKDKASYDAPADPALFDQAEEKALSAALEAAVASARPAVTEERFADAMAALAALRGPVDGFFEHVTVNCEDKEKRANRLRLLSRIRAALGDVADFTRIEG